ncbi:MAG: hypothetical protein JSW73_02845 [Candidatus Woesearchaeota archaeon]|nr:MAG: hypothetical protein JSW73_02845 [Candidatus Woesearchaeota archaeon]
MRKGLEKIIQKSKDLGRKTLDTISKPEALVAISVGCMTPVNIYSATGNTILSLVGGGSLGLLSYKPAKKVFNYLEKEGILIEENYQNGNESMQHM